jgi:hypothetical protein
LSKNKKSRKKYLEEAIIPKKSELLNKLITNRAQINKEKRITKVVNSKFTELEKKNIEAFLANKQDFYIREAGDQPGVHQIMEKVHSV